MQAADKRKLLVEVYTKVRTENEIESRADSRRQPEAHALTRAQGRLYKGARGAVALQF
jgi:hypothetical protein